MAIPTKANLIKIYSDEARKIRELTEQFYGGAYHARTTSGNVSWTSDSSLVTYDTSASADIHILNQGEDGLLYLLNTTFVNNIIDVDYLNAVNGAITESSLIYGVDAEVSDNYVIDLPIAPTSYVDGMMINFKANTANTGACSLNINALGAKTIKDIAGNDLITGAILAEQLVTVIYSGTYFIMTSDSKMINAPIITAPIIRNWNGWEDANETWTYASADSPTFTFTVTGDLTSKYSVGMRIRLTQTTAKYFIITAISYSSPDTTVTVYGGTDYTLTSATITNNYYSNVKAPYGFPLDPVRWTNITKITSDISQVPPTQNTWYNIGTVTHTVPIGAWELGFECLCNPYDVGGSFVEQEIALSTSNNSVSDDEFKCRSQFPGASADFMFKKLKTVTITSTTDYYLIDRTTVANQDGIRHLCATYGVPILIKSVCAYL